MTPDLVPRRTPRREYVRATGIATATRARALIGLSRRSRSSSSAAAAAHGQTGRAARRAAGRRAASRSTGRACSRTPDEDGCGGTRAAFIARDRLRPFAPEEAVSVTTNPRRSPAADSYNTRHPDDYFGATSWSRWSRARARHRATAAASSQCDADTAAGAGPRRPGLRCSSAFARRTRRGCAPAHAGIATRTSTTAGRGLRQLLPRRARRRGRRDVGREQVRGRARGRARAATADSRARTCDLERAFGLAPVPPRRPSPSCSRARERYLAGQPARPPASPVREPRFASPLLSQVLPRGRRGISRARARRCRSARPSPRRADGRVRPSSPPRASCRSCSRSSRPPSRRRPGAAKCGTALLVGASRVGRCPRSRATLARRRRERSRARHLQTARRCRAPSSRTSRHRRPELLGLIKIVSACTRPRWRLPCATTTSRRSR